MITGWYWEVVDEVGTYCIAFNPWVLLRYAYYYAMLVDVDWVSVSMTDVSIVNYGQVKVAT